MADMKLDNQPLRSAGNGEILATAILAALDRDESVRVDFAQVEMMTPSYANAMVMTLLDRFTVAELKTRCELANRSAVVIAAMNTAVRRYLGGIRLSTQRHATT